MAASRVTSYGDSVANHLGKGLVVYESLDDRQQLADALRGLHWLVEVAPTGELGIDAAMKQQPDVIIAQVANSGSLRVTYARTLRTCIEHDALIVGLTNE